MRKQWPHASSRAFSAAACLSSGSFPSVRIRQGPLLSQKAKPNLMVGTALMRAS